MVVFLVMSAMLFMCTMLSATGLDAQLANFWSSDTPPATAQMSLAFLRKEAAASPVF